MEKIHIKCPFCGAILEVVDNPANYSKYVTCPNCKHKDRFSNYLLMKADQASNTAADDETQVVLSRKGSLGYLLDKATGKLYPLREGHQIVGRKTQKTPSKADIPIATTDLGMSREHLSIDVVLGNDARYHIYVSNAKNQNPTTINGKLLEDKDKVGLRHGDIIKLCETPLQYIESPADDETMI